MKKLSCLFIFLIGISTFGFSKNFFAQRFFELQVGVPVSFSNNVLSFDDIMKEQLVIDLTKLSDSISPNGADIVIQSTPYFAMNFNIAVVHVGFSIGLDVYEKMNVSKDLFDFLGKGNEIGKPINVSINNYTDAFLYAEADLGINFGRFNIHAIPGIFMPVISSSGSLANVTFENKEDGSLDLLIKSNAEFLSNVDFVKINQLNVSEFLNDLSSGIGFDLGGQLSIPFGKTVLSAKARIPIVPGQLQYKMTNSVEKSLTINTAEIVSGDAQLNLNDLKIDNEDFNLTSSKLSEKVSINRPLKFNVFAKYSPIGNLLNLCAGGGIGVYHPFLSDNFMYPEYYLSAGINLIDMLKFTVSTEYSSQIFKHQIAFAVNIRLVEFECGASLQSTDFSKSFSNNGFGAYAIVSIGF